MITAFQKKKKDKTYHHKKWKYEHLPYAIWNKEKQRYVLDK
jgi:hypothetical protein